MSKAKRDDVPVKIDREVIRKARIVAAYRAKNLAEYLSERLGPLVDDDLHAHVREASPEPKRSGRHQ